MCLGFLSSVAFGYDCNSDCSGGGYNYPCPSLGNPGQMCRGDLPNDPACLAVKSAACAADQASLASFTSLVSSVRHGQVQQSCAEARLDEVGVGAACIACFVSACVTDGALAPACAMITCLAFNSAFQNAKDKCQ